MLKEIKIFLNDFKKGTITMFKEFFKKETNKKQRANMWTFLRLITPIISVTLSILGIIYNNKLFLIIAGIITALGALTDYLDGKSSRKHNSASEYGKVLDQVSDKIFSGVISINLIFFNSTYFITLLGELLISIVNMYYKVKHKTISGKSSLIGRIKEWPLFVTLSVGYLSSINSTYLLISNIFIIVTFTIQIATIISYIYVNEKEFKQNNIKKVELKI